MKGEKGANLIITANGAFPIQCCTLKRNKKDMFHWLTQTVAVLSHLFHVFGSLLSVYLFAGCPEFPLKKLQFHLNTHS